MHKAITLHSRDQYETSLIVIITTKNLLGQDTLLGMGPRGSVAPCTVRYPVPREACTVRYPSL